MTSEPTRVSSQEKRGKPQGCHERLLHHATARACIGLRSPARGGEHDNGSTLQLASGTVGASVFKDTMTVHLAALPPHPRGRSAILRREHAREEGGSCVAWDSGLQGFVGSMRCMGLTHTLGLCHGGHALRGTRSRIILEQQREVGGWRWLSGVRRCVSRKAPTHLATWLWLRLHQLAPLPVSRSKPGPHKHAPLHCCKNMSIPAVVSLRNNMGPTNLPHCYCESTRQQ